MKKFRYLASAAAFALSFALMGCGTVATENNVTENTESIAGETETVSTTETYVPNESLSAEPTETSEEAFVSNKYLSDASGLATNNTEYLSGEDAIALAKLLEELGMDVTYLDMSPQIAHLIHWTISSHTSTPSIQTTVLKMVSEKTLRRKSGILLMQNVLQQD